MARDRANIFTNIWTDAHWKNLSRHEQMLYLTLLTHPELNYAGVTDWRPGRLAALSGDATRKDIEATGASLQEKRFIAVDEETEEVLIRSYIKHDGVLRHPKLAISFVNAYGATHSKELQKIIVHELGRIKERHPDWKAFEFDKVNNLLDQPSAPMEAATLGLTHEPTLHLRVNSTEDLPLGLPVPTATATATSSKEDMSDFSDEKPRPDVERLLDQLDARVIDNGHRKPNRTKKNHDAARLLIDRDGYTEHQIAWMINWSTNHEFWRNNIRSMSKLREKFDELKAQATRDTGTVIAHASQEIDPDEILGPDYKMPPDPPEGLTMQEEMEFKQQWREQRKAERLEEARRKVNQQP